LTTPPEIRPGRPEDHDALRALYAAAFPDEPLWPLVAALLAWPEGVRSRVAARDGMPAGHLILTECAVSDSAARVALLGPLAVDPDRQRQGIGGALVRDALAAERAGETAAILVLGDPGFYGRFGFRPETGIAPPYPLPEAWLGAWQSIRFNDRPGARGRLRVPAPWARPELWR